MQLISEESPEWVQSSQEPRPYQNMILNIITTISNSQVAGPWMQVKQSTPKIVVSTGGFTRYAEGHAFAD